MRTRSDGPTQDGAGGVAPQQLHLGLLYLHAATLGVLGDVL